MKTALKAVLGLAALLVVLAAAVVLLAPRFIDPNDYKSEIADAVRDATGRELTIEGEIKLSFFPWLGADLGRVALGQAPQWAAPAERDGHGQPFLSAERTKVRVKLLPLLLSRSLEMDTVSSQGLTVNLVRNAEGRGNWEDLLAARTPAAQGGSGFELAALALGGIEAEDASVRWHDHAAGTVVAIERLSLRTGAISLHDLDKPVALKAGFDFTARTPAFATPAKGSARTTAQVAYTPEWLRVRELNGRFDATGGPVEQLAGAISGELEIAPASGEVRSGGLTVAVDSFAAAGIAGSITASAALQAGSGEAAAVNVSGLAARGSLRGPALGGGSARFELAADVTADLKARLVKLAEARLSLAEFDVRGVEGKLSARASVEGLLAERRFLLRGLALEGSLTRAGPLAGTMPIVAAGEVQLALAEGRVSASGLTLTSRPFEVAEAAGSLTVAVDSVVAHPGKTAVELGNLRAELDARGSEARPGQITASARGDVVLAGGRVRSPRLEVDATELEVGGLQGRAALAGALELRLAAGELMLSQLTGAADLEGAALGPGDLKAKIGATRADLGLASTRFDLTELALEVAEFSLAGYRGRAEVRGALTGTVSAGQYAAKGLRVRGAVSGGALPQGTLPVDLATDAVADLKQGTARLSALQAQVAELSAQGEVGLAGLGGAGAQADGTLRLTTDKLRGLLARGGLTPRTADPGVLERARVRATFRAGADSLALSDLEAELDVSTLRGALSVRRATVPQVRFDLVLNGIDADRYLPPPRAPAAGVPAGSSAQSPPAVLPIAALTQLYLDGRLQIGKLKLNGLRMSDVRLTARAKDRQLTLAPAEARLYQGTFDGEVTVDARNPSPVITARQELRGVQAGPLLTDLNGKATVTGRADLKAALTASGATGEALLRNANGNAEFIFRDGTIRGVDMVRTICGKLSGLGVVAAAQRPAEETKFSELTGTAVVERGVARNRDLSVASPFLRITGEGAVDLVSEQIDYRLTSHLVDSCEGQGRGTVEALVNVPIPIAVGGTLRSPTWAFDFARLVQTLTRRQIEKQGSRLLEKALGRGDAPAASPAPAPQGGAAPAPPPPTKPEDVLKGVLKGILGR